MVQAGSRWVVLVLVLAPLSPMPARADPITIAVTGGHLTTEPTSTFAQFQLSGIDGFQLSGRWPGTIDACRDCRVGGMVNATGRLAYDAVPFVFGDPFATAQGVVGAQAVTAFLAGQLSFLSPSLTIPSVSFPEDQGVLFNIVLPFTFSGHIAGYDGLRDGPHEPTRLFDAALFGSGQARVDLRGTSTGGVTHLHYVRTTYDFTPVPEPGTLMLLGTGVTIVVTRRSSLRAARARRGRECLRSLKLS